MTFPKRFPFALALALFALTAGARAQSPAIEVASGEGRVEFSSDGRLAEMRVEVFAPSGELIFDSGAVVGQSIEWKMQTNAGKRVADGVYLATITVMDAAGNRRKRIEQIKVSSAAADDSGPTPTAFGPISGEGTNGRIAKFTGANAIANSIMAEAAGRIGVNDTSPSATLQVNADQPAALPGNGTIASLLLQTTGGKGGNTTGAAAGVQTAGAGASISLAAGNGGDAPAGNKRGAGGNIVLQAGSTGGGAGTAGVNGNVLIGPSGVGNVGIGTSTPKSKLTVTGGDIQIATAGKGIVFPDTSLQTTAALTAVQHNTTLTGLGTAGSPLGINPNGVTSAHLANGSVGVTELNTAAVPAAGQVLTYSGGGLTWQTPAGGGGVTAFRHTRTAATNCGPAGLTSEFSPLNHASINGNPNAKIFVTAIVGITATNSDANQNYFIVYTGAAAFGTCPAGRWLIRGGDADPSNFDGAQYNVLIVN